MDIHELKKCTKCAKLFEATLKYFPPHKHCAKGLNPECRGCHNARVRKWKQANSVQLAEKRRVDYRARYGDRQRALERRRFETFPIRVQAENLQSGVRERCKTNGWAFPVEFKNKAFFTHLLEAQPNCPCCGIAFHIGPKSGRPRDASPSIDRFSILEPYSVQNIALICWRCNNIKRNYSAADLRMVAVWIDRHGNETQKFGEVAA